MAERDYREELFTACQKHFPGIGWRQYGVRCEGTWTRVLISAKVLNEDMVLANTPSFEAFALFDHRQPGKEKRGAPRRWSRHLYYQSADDCMAEMRRVIERTAEDLRGVLRD